LRRAESAGLDYKYRAWLGYRRMRARLDLQLARDLGCDSGLSEPDYDVLSTVSEAPGQRMPLARSTGEPLLFKGNDFGHTDITPALPASPDDNAG
jgi:hypothetical protein